MGTGETLSLEGNSPHVWRSANRLHAPIIQHPRLFLHLPKQRQRERPRLGEHLRAMSRSRRSLDEAGWRIATLGATRDFYHGLPAGRSDILIAQTPSHVVILRELIHDVRVIPLDGRPHLDTSIRQWHGDSRGHWEGDTLVIETTTFAATSRSVSIGGGGDTRRVVERFTRVGPDAIRWDVTYDDPSTWTQPWTAAIALHKSDGAIFEYACHEGNYAMEGILAGARAREQAEQ